MKTLLLLLSLLAAAPEPVTAPAAPDGFIAADDGAQLYYRVEGAGAQTLVVVHGGPGNSMESVRLDLAPLARGRRVIYYDQRGNGRSELVELARVGIDRQVADLEAIRRHFGLETMNLLGNSWGGLLASAYAAAHPDRIERLVLHAPAPPRAGQLEALNDEFSRRATDRLTRDEQRRLNYAARPDHWRTADDPVAICRAFMTAVFTLYRHDPDRDLAFRGDVCAGPAEAVRRQQAVNRAIWDSMGDFDYRPAVRRVTAPVLVVYGESDAIPLGAAQDWAASFGDARLLVVPGAGHLVHLERPDLFFPSVERFLAGEWPAEARRVERPAPSRAD